MLKRGVAVLSCFLFIATFIVECEPISSEAAECSAATANGGGYQPIGISVSCSTTVSGSEGNDAGTNESAGGTGCYKSDGTEVACWNSGYWWSPTKNRYCKVADLTADDPQWNFHKDGAGQPIGTIYQCLLFQDENIYDLLRYTYVWANETPETPVVPGTDPKTLVERAVVSLGLHPPEAGVGAYVYPGYEDWGLTWWVGAPMWLWTDSDDDLQWGTHNLTAADGGLSVTATVTATSLTFDPGNGDTPVTCDTAGTPRPWNPDAPLAQHSPSGCDYTYMTTNTLGDKDSRFAVSATVTWTVTWSSSDGQYGTFTTTTTSTDNPGIHIGELRTVLVPPR